MCNRDTAHYRFEPCAAIYATVTSSRRTIAAQLKKAIGETPKREVAKRLAAINGTSIESERRGLYPLLRGDTERPSQETLSQLEKALDLPAGYFKIPDQKTRAEEKAERKDLEDQVADAIDRLEELEADTTDLLIAASALLRNQAAALRVLGVPENQIEQPELLREPQRARRAQRGGG